MIKIFGLTIATTAEIRKLLCGWCREGECYEHRVFFDTTPPKTKETHK